jgi:hypothetical protein
MFNRFQIQTIIDDQNYITDVFINDTDNLISNYRHPLRLNILELLQLFDAIKPIIEEYKRWKKKYDKEG